MTHNWKEWEDGNVPKQPDPVGKQPNLVGVQPEYVIAREILTTLAGTMTKRVFWNEARNDWGPRVEATRYTWHQRYGTYASASILPVGGIWWTILNP